MKTTLLLISLAATVLLNGCIGILPVPPNREESVMGTPITKEQTRFIVRGQTTREEVIAHFGDRFRESPREPLMAYSWEKPAWGWTWWFLFITPGGEVVSGGDYDEGNDWRAFYLKFDSNGHVEKTNFAKLDNSYSLDEQLENWGWGKSTSFFKDGAGIFNPVTGTPLLFDGMRRHLDHSDLQVTPTR
jgi:hypothetical protein